MKILREVHLLLVFLVFLNTFPTTCISQKTNISHCGKMRIQNQFFLPNSTQLSLNHMLLCRAQKLYYRTTLGLFQVSSIDFSSKLFTVSHSFWSSTSHFISPTVLSDGFPHPPQPNSLILFNCSSQKTTPSAFASNCNGLHGYRGSSKPQKPPLAKGISSCFVIDDVQKLDLDFHPREMNCTHYSRVYPRDQNNFEFELGTRISFDIPDHVPNPCDECKKPNGNCGIGLRCICHPIECKDKVISFGVMLNPFGNLLFFSFLCFTAVLDLYNNS